MRHGAGLICEFRFHSTDSRLPVTLHVHHIVPVVSIVAGVLILIQPRLLNYIVAIYLILAGLLGLGWLPA